MLKKIKDFKWGYILLFILLAAVGVCFLSFSDTLTALALTVGILLAVYGTVLATITIAAKGRGAGFALRIVISVAAIVGGVITAVMRASAMEIIASLICLFLIVDGSFKLQTTASSKRFNLLAWWLMLIPSVLCIIGGFIGLRWAPDILTDEGVTRVSVIIGITLIVAAVGNLLSAFYISKYEHNMREEIELEVYAQIEEKKRKEEEEAAKEEAEEAKKPVKRGFFGFKKKDK